jgi:hypothetical protein
MPFLRRSLAAFGVALVLLLTVSSVSPRVHEQLHGAAGHVAGDQCAVVLFASGVTLVTALVVLLAAKLEWRTIIVPIVVELGLVSPRYLRQPERGPPAC